MANNFLKIYKGVSYAPQSAAPSNPVDGDVYYDSTLNKFRGYQNGSWQDLITDGADGINYILNPGAEAGAEGYVTYADAAAAAPVDGLGGSPSFVTWTRTTTPGEILRQDASFKLTKSSGNAQGEGVAYDLSIDPRDKNSKLQISFDFKNLDSNYVDGDLKMFVYDVDNSALLGNVINDDDGDIFISSSDGGSFVGEITSTDSLNYRLIFHVAGTTTTNWALSVDRIKFGPVNGLVVANREREKVVFRASNGSVPTNTDSIATITNVIQDTKGSISGNTFVSQKTGTYRVIGKATFANSSTGFRSINIFDANAGTFLLRPLSAAGVGSTATSLAFFEEFSLAEGEAIDFRFRQATGSNESCSMEVEIEEVEVETNIVSNNQLNQQTIKAKYTGATTAITSPSATTVIQPDKVYDTHNSYNSSTGEFTAPRSGQLTVKHGWIASNASASSGNNGIFMALAVNSVTRHFFARFRYQTAVNSTPVGEGSVTIDVQKGDVIKIDAGKSGAVGATSMTGASESCYTAFELLPDFTSYGVLNPKTEYREVIYQDTTGDITNGSLFVAPGPSEFDLELTEGEWLVGYHISVAQESLGATGQMNYQAALHLDGTLQSGTETYVNHQINSSTQGTYHMLSSTGKVVVNSTQNLQLRVQGTRSTASLRNRMLSVNWTGATAGIDTAPKLWALKIK